MPSIEVSNYLPEDTSVLAAFNIIKSQHNLERYAKRRLPKRIPSPFFDKYSFAVSEFLLASVVHLAHRESDRLISDSAKNTITAFESGLVVLWFVRNMKTAPAILGFAEEIGIVLSSENDQPHILFEERRSSLESNLVFEQGHILIPQEFVQAAYKSPVEALTMTVFLCSQVNDFIMGRSNQKGLVSDHDDDSTIRAEAAQAHYLLSIKINYPDLPLPASAVDILKKYPRGLRSIPRGLWYKGTVQKPSNVDNN